MNTDEDLILPSEIDNFTRLTASAEQGDASSQYELGRYYMEDNSQQDLQKSLYWFTKAAENGNAQAFYRLGQIYERGIIVEKDCAKSEQMFLKSADLGCGWAYNRLADIYLQDEQPDKALHYLEMLHDQCNIIDIFSFVKAYKALGRYNDALNLLRRGVRHMRRQEGEEFFISDLEDEISEVLPLVMKQYKRKPRPKKVKEKKEEPAKPELYVGDLFQGGTL